MPATNDQKLAFRDATAATFAGIEKQFGIHARLALVQSALESNWGISQLAVLGKNIFSMTPGGRWLQAKRGETDMASVPHWSKLGIPTVAFPTTEYSRHSPEAIHYWDFAGDIVAKRPDGNGGSILTVERHFRQYQSWDESAWDWARMIAQSERYQPAYLCARGGDLKGFAKALVVAQYATDPAYIQELVVEATAVDSLPAV